MDRIETWTKSSLQRDADTDGRDRKEDDDDEAYENYDKKI